MAGGAGSELTMRANLRAFERWEIVPRMLRDVSERDLSTTVLGTPMPAPVLLAPVGVQSIVHPEAELAVCARRRRAGAARDPQHRGLALARAGRRGDRRGEPLVSAVLAQSIATSPRASWAAPSDAGYEAIVVTLDTWLLGWRPRDLQNAYLPFLKGEGVANYFSDPVFRAALERPPEEDPGRRSGTGPTSSPTRSVTWADLEWLREQTNLPIVLKGIIHADGRATRARGRRRRADRLQPRRSPGRRLDRRARRAAGRPRSRRR